MARSRPRSSPWAARSLIGSWQTKEDRHSAFRNLNGAMPTANRANVAALIPSYFEEKHIREVATAVKAQLDLVLVVDDGSTDRTSDEARAASVEVIRHENNAGKGAAIKTGLRNQLDRPGVEFILVLDGDGQHLPSESPT